MFLLDGYDEIFSNKKQQINSQIELFVDSYSQNRFLITTRPGSGIEGFPRFYDFRVNSLEDKDVEGFISKIVDAGERKDRIIKIIKDPKNKNYFEYLRNPLLLSMFILAFENHPEIPQRKSAFYRNVFDTLYSRHDGITKNSFPREKITKLQRDDFEYLLTIFSYLTLIEGRYSFTQEYLSDTLAKVKNSTTYNFVIEDIIYDLRTSISILILDGFEYSFPHRSMQEYFTALFVNRLPTEKKNKAYSNLSKALQESTTDYSFNFWSLCYELDETVFVSNFLIPQLKKIYKKLENKEGRELLDEYFAILNPVLFPFDLQPNSQDNICIFRHPSIQNSILDFCAVYKYADICFFPRTSGCQEKLNEIYRKNDESKTESERDLSIYVRKNEEVISLLIEYDLPDLIKKFRNQISQKIAEWDLNIKKKKNSIDDLLKI